jgi:predicted nucleic acid-binding protein
MKKPATLDSFAVLAWLQDEPGADRVEAALLDARERGRPLFLNAVNLGEVYYILARERGHAYAEQIIHQLEALPLTLTACDTPLALAAARVKADHAIAYADTIAVATAQRENAVLLTGDPEFKQVETLVEIDWLPPLHKV